MTEKPIVPNAGSADSEIWGVLRAMTPARVALGRSGSALPTGEVLRFGHAHALARDAVHCSLDTGRVAEQLAALGFESLEVASAAPNRATYLRRPDLGRRLAPEGRVLIEGRASEGFDLAIIVADGLSATAVQANAANTLAALRPGLLAAGWSLGPIVVATQARVALGDEIGALLKARMALILIGERPGLSSPDSLGAYLTFAPRLGRRDNERNCVSNIRPAGLAPERAAGALLWLIAEAFRRSLTGVALKDESEEHSLPLVTVHHGSISTDAGVRLDPDATRDA